MIELKPSPRMRAIGMTKPKNHLRANSNFETHLKDASHFYIETQDFFASHCDFETQDLFASHCYFETHSKDASQL